MVKVSSSIHCGSLAGLRQGCCPGVAVAQQHDMPILSGRMVLMAVAWVNSSTLHGTRSRSVNACEPLLACLLGLRVWRLYFACSELCCGWFACLAYVLSPFLLILVLVELSACTGASLFLTDLVAWKPYTVAHPAARCCLYR